MTSQKIVKCGKCNGKGYTIKEDKYYNEYEIPCSICNAFGFILEEVEENNDTKRINTFVKSKKI